MTKFVDCLVRLPNLRALDILSATHIDLVTEGFWRNCARFPSIRELAIHNELVKFVGKFPNVESIKVIESSHGCAEVVGLHGKGLKKLKRVAGIVEGEIWQGEYGNTFWSEAPDY